MNHIRLFIFLLVAVSTSTLSGQRLTDQLPDRIDIPFKYVNGFIILEVQFNYVFPLKFILDTGAEHTILTKREYAEMLEIPFEREFRIIGSDMQSDLRAYLIRQNHLEIGNLILGNQSMVVMDDDYFRFEEFTGVPIHGIIGANIFRHFIVKINYQRGLISLYRPIGFEPPKDYEKVPLEIFKNKPYLTTILELGDQTRIPVKLLLDTGASLTLLLHNGTHPAIQPNENMIPGNIGKGLGGYLEGFIGRARNLEMGSYSVPEVISNFQDLNPEMDTTFLNHRNGILGNLVLARFTIIIDYFREELYLKPNKFYNNAFVYDRSGLVVVASGEGLDTHTIYSVMRNSPAGEAGLLPGDEILRVNGLVASYLQLNGINRKFKKKPGKKIRIVIRRDGTKMKLEFILRDLI